MMIDSNFFIHELDKAALQTLKAIPGFTQLMKAFMKLWSERILHIENMSTNLQISEEQLPMYYHLLPPICEKLGIDIPEIYLKSDATPNAYTYGDTKPFIVITSGLIETLPKELIPTVIAHECGHIACHHALYTTMGHLLLSGAGDVVNLFGLGDIVMRPIKAAFLHWMKCSEYSADRAAMVCDGTADKTLELCLRFSEPNKDIAAEPNIEAFPEQAAQYKKLVDDNKIRKAMELLMLVDNTYPPNMVRAFECNDWQKSESFINITNHMKNPNPATCEKIPLTLVPDRYVGKDYRSVEAEFYQVGFTNVELIRKINADPKKYKQGQVLEIVINGKTKLKDADWYPRTSDIEVVYYPPESAEEIALAQPGQIQIPNSSKGYHGKNCDETVAELRALGFTNISLYEQESSKLGWLRKENSLTRMTINGQTEFNIGDWFSSDATIRITLLITAK